MLPRDSFHFSSTFVTDTGDAIDDVDELAVWLTSLSLGTDGSVGDRAEVMNSCLDAFFSYEDTSLCILAFN